MTSTDNREKALELALSTIEKQYGKGAIMRLGDSGAVAAVPVVPTGSISLDMALGVGGYPRGRIVEIYGPESSGKTTLTLHAIAQCQRAGGVAAFIDAEHALDLSYAKKLGVNTEALLVSQPDYGEQALEIADLLVRSGAVDLIVVDSVAALVPKAEIEGEMGDTHVGLQARLMSQALRKLTATVHKSNTILFFHQPDSHEDWCDVWLTGDHFWGQCLKVLLFCPVGCASCRNHQNGRSSRRQPYAGQSRQKQNGAAISKLRV
jgi:recombination protein RecA